jgi:hypothetical protein
MVKQYPYELYVFETSGDYQDGNGDWQNGTSSWNLISKCRDESNTKSAQIKLDDETAYTFESLIQMPKLTITVEVGLNCEVRDLNGNVRVKGAIRRFSNDQLHTRLWL